MKPETRNEGQLLLYLRLDIYAWPIVGYVYVKDFKTKYKISWNDLITKLISDYRKQTNGMRKKVIY